MPYPELPAIDYSYTGFSQSQGDNSFPGTQLDNDLANLKSSVDATINFLKSAFRSDGVLQLAAYPSAADLMVYAEQAAAEAAAIAASLTVKDVTGSSYTVLLADGGKLLRLTNSTAITLTLPNSLPAGFDLVVVQGGAGQITFSPASGASLETESSETKTEAQNATVGVVVRKNVDDVSAIYLIGGRTTI